LSFLLYDLKKNYLGRHEKYKLYHEYSKPLTASVGNCEGWNFNSGNYLFTTDTK